MNLRVELLLSIHEKALQYHTHTIFKPSYEESYEKRKDTVQSNFKSPLDYSKFMAILKCKWSVFLEDMNMIGFTEI